MQASPHLHQSLQIVDVLQLQYTISSVSIQVPVQFQGKPRMPTGLLGGWATFLKTHIAMPDKFAFNIPCCHHEVVLGSGSNPASMAWTWACKAEIA